MQFLLAALLLLPFNGLFVLADLSHEDTPCCTDRSDAVCLACEYGWTVELYCTSFLHTEPCWDYELPCEDTARGLSLCDHEDCPGVNLEAAPYWWHSQIYCMATCGLCSEGTNVTGRDVGIDISPTGVCEDNDEWLAEYAQLSTSRFSGAWSSSEKPTSCRQAMNHCENAWSSGAAQALCPVTCGVCTPDSAVETPTLSDTVSLSTSVSDVEEDQMLWMCKAIAMALNGTHSNCLCIGTCTTLNLDVSVANASAASTAITDGTFFDDFIAPGGMSLNSISLTNNEFFEIETSTACFVNGNCVASNNYPSSYYSPNTGCSVTVLKDAYFDVGQTWDIYSDDMLSYQSVGGASTQFKITSMPASFQANDIVNWESGKYLVAKGWQICFSDEEPEYGCKDWCGLLVNRFNEDDRVTWSEYCSNRFCSTCAQCPSTTEPSSTQQNNDSSTVETSSSTAETSSSTAEPSSACATTNGNACHLPFIHATEGTAVMLPSNRCAKESESRAWCYTNAESTQWGYCNDNCLVHDTTDASEYISPPESGSLTLSVTALAFALCFFFF